MNNSKKINDEIFEDIYHHLNYITSQMNVDIDENNIFHDYRAYEWTIRVLKYIDLCLKEIKNHSKEKENINNIVKSIDHIMNANKEYYDK